MFLADKSRWIRMMGGDRSRGGRLSRWPRCEDSSIEHFRPSGKNGLGVFGWRRRVDFWVPSSCWIVSQLVEYY